MYTRTVPKIRQFVYTTTGALRATVVVYIESVVFFSSLHIHQEMVYTSYSLIFSRTKSGGGVYFWGPYYQGLSTLRKLVLQA